MHINNCKNRPKSGRPHSICTNVHIKKIYEKLRRNPQRSANITAAKQNVSHRTVKVLINEDLSFHPCCKRKIQGLIAAQRIKGLQCKECKELLM